MFLCRKSTHSDRSCICTGFPFPKVLFATFRNAAGEINLIFGQHYIEKFWIEKVKVIILLFSMTRLVRASEINSIFGQHQSCAAALFLDRIQNQMCEYI